MLFFVLFSQSKKKKTNIQEYKNPPAQTPTLSHPQPKKNKTADIDLPWVTIERITKRQQRPHMSVGYCITRTWSEDADAGMDAIMQPMFYFPFLENKEGNRYESCPHLASNFFGTKQAHQEKRFVLLAYINRRVLTVRLNTSVSSADWI